MTLNPSLSDPFEWHWSKEKPCPVCGWTKFVGQRGQFFEHRRSQVGEPGVFAVRSRKLRDAKTEAGQRLRYLTASGMPADVGPKRNTGNRSNLRGKRGEHGPTATTRAAIQRATTMLANGRRRSDIVKALKSSPHCINDWQFTWPQLWQECYDAAMVTVRETVRQLAGTPSMPEDLDTYVLAGVRAYEWSHGRGEKLFDRGDALTLPEFYERHYLPLRPQAKETIEFHQIVLRRWAVLTGDPPLAEITKEHLALFRDSLSKMRSLKSVGYMSPNTVVGYMKKVQAFLDKAGPAGPRNRDAVELIAKVPWVKPPREIYRAVRIVSEETLNNFYLGCVAASRPRSADFKPPAWWRALVVVPYNLGIRRGTLFALRMQWINWERRCIIIPPEVTKTGQEQILPMNAVVFEHLNAIRGERERVFDFGRCIDRYFYTYWHRLQDACGIPSDQHFGLHDLRRTCATVLWEHNPQVAQFALGHASDRMTRKHYVLGQGMLARAVEQMPQPSAFGGKDGGRC